MLRKPQFSRHSDRCFAPMSPAISITPVSSPALSTATNDSNAAPFGSFSPYFTDMKPQNTRTSFYPKHDDSHLFTDPIFEQRYYPNKGNNSQNGRNFYKQTTYISENSCHFGMFYIFCSVFVFGNWSFCFSDPITFRSDLNTLRSQLANLSLWCQF